MYMNGYGYYGNGIGTVSLLLIFLIKFLFLIFIITLVIGLFVAAKNYFFTTDDLSALKKSFSETISTKTNCTECGKAVNRDWKVCPHCGTQLNHSNNRQEETVYEKPLA